MSEFTAARYWAYKSHVVIPTNETPDVPVQCFGISGLRRPVSPLSGFAVVGNFEEAIDAAPPCQPVDPPSRWRRHRHPGRRGPLASAWAARPPSASRADRSKTFDEGGDLGRAESACKCSTLAQLPQMAHHGAASWAWSRRSVVLWMLCC